MKCASQMRTSHISIIWDRLLCYVHKTISHLAGRTRESGPDVVHDCGPRGGRRVERGGRCQPADAGGFCRRIPRCAALYRHGRGAGGNDQRRRPAGDAARRPSGAGAADLRRWLAAAGREAAYPRSGRGGADRRPGSPGAAAINGRAEFPLSAGLPQDSRAGDHGGGGRARLWPVHLPAQPGWPPAAAQQIPAHHAPPHDARAEHPSPRPDPLLLRP